MRIWQLLVNYSAGSEGRGHPTTAFVFTEKEYKDLKCQYKRIRDNCLQKKLQNLDDIYPSIRWETKHF